MTTEEASDRRAHSELRRLVDQHEYRLSNLDTVPGALQAIERRMSDTEHKLTAMDQRLADNTAITQQIRDAQIAGKVLGKLLGWISAIGAAGAAVWGALYQITHWRSP